jgi:hypothetical protein
MGLFTNALYKFLAKHAYRGFTRYENYNYPLVYLNYKDYGDITIGPEKLKNVLLNSDGSCVNKEAELIDRGILFYVPDLVILGSKKSIIKYLDENLF